MESDFNSSCSIGFLSNNSELYNDTETHFDSTIPTNIIFHGFGILLLTIVGVPLNILSVIVLNNPRLKSTLSTLLLGMTVSDIFVSILAFLTLSLNPIASLWYGNITLSLLKLWLKPLLTTTLFSSIYFRVIITLER